LGERGARQAQAGQDQRQDHFPDSCHSLFSFSPSPISRIR
jgi:hypothetical protein